MVDELSDVMGKKLVDAEGYVPEGDDLHFEITKFIFEDGTEAFAEGSHDTVSLSSYSKNNEYELSNENLEKWQICNNCGNRMMYDGNKWICSAWV